MMLVDVPEYGKARLDSLSREQRDALLSCGGDLSLAPEPGSDSAWILRTGSQIGTVVCPGLTVRIRPKLTIARLFVMLSAASGAICWDERYIGLDASSTVEDVVAMVFVDSVRRALASGLLRGYVAVEEESMVVRGRLEFAETIRRRPLALIPIVQTPEFLDCDTPENQILATALVHLARRVQSDRVRNRVLDCQRAFAGVTVLSERTPLPRVTKNRLNGKWWNAIELALLVLRSCGLDLPSGLHASRSFLVDMNAVFERFVHRALADQLRPLSLDLQHNRGGIDLDKDGLHSLRPDLSLWSGSRCVFAGDCKYKFSPTALSHRDDVYQCLAYAAATGLPHVTLFYAGDQSAARDIAIADGRTRVLVRTLNLAAPIEQLRSQCESLALEIAGGGATTS